jgi:hypothetical protein
MRLSWWWLTESDFDRDAYQEGLPAGTWQAVVEQSAWGKGAAGIHLYVRRLDSGERYWIFIPWARHDLYELFRALPDGSRIELCVKERDGQKKSRLLSAADLGPVGEGEGQWCRCPACRRCARATEFPPSMRRRRKVRRSSIPWRSPTVRCDLDRGADVCASAPGGAGACSRIRRPLV